MTGRSVGTMAGMYGRGMRVRLGDRVWEIEVRGAGAGTFVDLRRADERPRPVRLTVVAALQPEPAAALRFEIGNPVQLAELHNALALTMAHGRGDLLAVEHPDDSLGHPAGQWNPAHPARQPGRQAD